MLSQRAISRVRFRFPAAVVVQRDHVGVGEGAEGPDPVLARALDASARGEPREAVNCAQSVFTSLQLLARKSRNAVTFVGTCRADG